MDNKKTLYEWSESYYQEADCCSSDFQMLRLKAIDGGGGHYLLISTRRWAIDPDEIDAFCTMLKDFMKKGKQ